MNERRPRARFSLVIEDAASPADEDTPPAIIRLRKVLKVLLRSLGFRCVEAREVRDDRQAGQAAQISDLIPPGRPG
jgi:hypothetical protein